MRFGYLGGMFRREEADRRLGQAEHPPSNSWRCALGDKVLFLLAEGWDLRVSKSGKIAALVRGYAVDDDVSGPCDPSSAADRMLSDYLKRGELTVDGWEGSFTAILADGDVGRLIIHRNLVGTGFTYYSESLSGFLFGSNLAELAGWVEPAPEPNRASLPVFFLYRFVPGRETLFAKVYRIVPGERVTYDGHRLLRMQAQTMADLRGSGPVRGDVVERLDATMSRILGDCTRLYPGATNLLSGGVDSSYIQCNWNRLRGEGGEPPTTTSISCDHRQGRSEDEYAVSASEALRTRHTLIKADLPIATCLVETISGTGEPPNHVQTSYFRLLGRSLANLGTDCALCGEGADSLFGVGQTGTMQTARLLRSVLPARFLEYAASLARRAGLPTLPTTLRLASLIDDTASRDYPVNQVAVFTDFRSVEACFGGSAIEKALAYRCAMLEQYGIGDDPLERVNFAGFLGEAMDSGSLWTSLLNLEGCRMICPFLDSRMIRLVLSIEPRERYPLRKPKELLKRALRQHGPRMLADRPKRGFGQPIFDWLAPGGQLRSLAGRIAPYDFLDRTALAASLREPNWFLYSLLCYDLWHKLFIDHSPIEQILCTSET